jgi:membrane protein YqaA with SNARE-associated domain
MDWIELGYFGILIATFLAATVIPFSSELVFSAAILNGFDPMLTLILASLGNSLGGMTSYGLGYLGNWRTISRYLRIEASKVEQWKRSIDRYGAYTALLCWAPFVGDVIAVALGLFRVNLWRAAFWMTLGKTARYAILIWIMLD